MKIRDVFTTPSGINEPDGVTAAMLKADIPGVEPVIDAMDFASAKELAEAVTAAWFTAATDPYLLSKATQTLFPKAKLLLDRARKICTSPNMEKNLAAVAEGLWLSKFERKELERRRKDAFGKPLDNSAYKAAAAEIQAVYGFSAEDMERFRYCICQARRDGSDPALNRSLYLFSKEKMTGKTTVAKIIAGVLNGYSSWMEVERNAGCYMSDIPTELQFGTFDRPKAARWACVVMDEAFAGKSTAKYYGKFKSAMTSDTASVQVKFGGTFDIRCTRNYIFTSNNDISSVVSDESERRLLSVEIRKPEQRPYSDIFRIWRDYIVNAPDEENVAAWYTVTVQMVKGETGIQKDDIVSSLLSPEFLQYVRDYRNGIAAGISSDVANGREVSTAAKFQLNYPKQFADFLGRSYDVKKNWQLVKDSVITAFGPPKESMNRRYYNIKDIIGLLEAAVGSEEVVPTAYTYAELDLPY